MTDTDLLLRAIIDEPSDDDPRLKYADVVEEQGHAARAEFIRVQCELARRRFSVIDTGQPGLGIKYVCSCSSLQVCNRCCALYEREQWLLPGYWKNWMPDLSPHLLACGNRDHFPGTTLSSLDPHIVMTFRRGFVESVFLTTSVFLEVAAALFRAQPITSVTLADREPWGGYHEPPIELFHWYDAGQVESGYHPQSDVPTEIWQLIQGEIHESRYKLVDSKFAAQALSDACVAYGRKKALDK
jgi:uncharacterized protein (TIGR02996 family)